MPKEEQFAVERLLHPGRQAAAIMSTIALHGSAQCHIYRYAHLGANHISWVNGNHHTKHPG